MRLSGQHIQRMQKALELMNLKLTKVLGDVTGVTGLKIIRAILAGERDPQELAKLRDRRCQHTAAEIATALDGRYRAGARDGAALLPGDVGEVPGGDRRAGQGDRRAVAGDAAADGAAAAAAQAAGAWPQAARPALRRADGVVLRDRAWT